jgi:hypothetical protein
VIFVTWRRQLAVLSQPVHFNLMPRFSHGRFVSKFRRLFADHSTGDGFLNLPVSIQLSPTADRIVRLRRTAARDIVRKLFDRNARLMGGRSHDRGPAY